MQQFTTILTLLVLVALFSVIARRLAFPYPIFLMVVGVALSLVVPLLPVVNTLPRVELNPDIVFTLFLPPILYAAAWYTSWRDFKANLEPISVLAIGMVFATTFAVAWAASTFIPGMTWTTAVVLGAIVSPPDAAAATAVTQRLGLPGRIMTILEGESLVNDASGLVAYKFAVAAVVSGTFSLASATGQFMLLLLAAIPIGLAVGWIATQIHKALDGLDTAVDITITLLTPFAAYLLAETIHASGVIAVVTAGLYVGRRAPMLHSSRMRVSAIAVWELFIFLLNGLIFILIGLNLTFILNSLSPRHTPWELALYALVVNAAAIGIRLGFVYAADAVSRLVRKVLKKKLIFTSWKHTMIIAWTGMRGIVSLAAAFALPYTIHNGEPFPNRDLLLFLTFSVIVGTLVFQGLTLPTLIRRLDIGSDEAACRTHEKAVRLQAINAAQRYIAEQQDALALPDYIVEYVTASHDHRILHLDHDAEENEVAVLSVKLHREALDIERQTVVRLRNQGIISDEVLHRIERDLDIEELRLPEKAQKNI